MAEKEKYTCGGDFHTYKVKEPPCGYESNLCSLWASLPVGTVLDLENDLQAVLLDPGKANTGNGPDFLGAKLRFGKRVKEGDISVHCRVSDFIRHGHVADKAYDNVILQSAQVNDLKSPPPEKMKKIPLFLINGEKTALLIEKYGRKAQEKALEKAQEKTETKYLPEKMRGEEKNISSIVLCPFLASLSPEEQKEYFWEGAKIRLKEKAENILRQLIANGTEMAFLEQVFLFAGYPDNGNAFRSLFVTYSHYPLEVRQKNSREILWGESGLLPDPASAQTILPECSEYAKELWKKFWQNRTGDKVKPSWNHSGSLYGNSPERRLALLCSLLEKFSSSFLEQTAERLKREKGVLFGKNILKELEIKDPFWECHNSFKSAKIIRNRTLFSMSKRVSFCVDVLVPSLCAFGQLKKDALLLQELEIFYLSLPLPGVNTLIRKGSDFWFDGKRLPESSAEAQGWLFLYKKYCSTLSHDCENCILASP